MIIIKGCTSDVIGDISEYIGSLSIDDVNLYSIGDEQMCDITLAKKTVLFYHPDEIIIQKSVEDSSRYAIAGFRFREVTIT